MEYGKLGKHGKMNFEILKLGKVNFEILKHFALFNFMKYLGHNFEFQNSVSTGVTIYVYPSGASDLFDDFGTFFNQYSNKTDQNLLFESTRAMPQAAVRLDPVSIKDHK